jgi:FKBP-type peptidyl-prolyl cis-trans isomerase (trigger factor)
MSEQITNKVIKQKEKSVLTIAAELPAETLEKFFEQALKNLGANLDLPGFRKGKAPKTVVLQKVGEWSALEEAAKLAIRQTLPTLLAEEEKIIGSPEIKIKKIARGNPLEFEIKCYLYPEVTLPPYRDLAKEIFGAPPETIEVTDAEVEKTIEEIRKSRSPAGGAPPTLDDTFVKTLGNFNDVADFKNKIRENLLAEKKFRAGEKRRLALADKLIAQSELVLPDILIDNELEKMFLTFRADVERMGFQWSSYLKEVGQTESEIKEKIKPEARKRAALQVILRQISVLEKIAPTKEQVDTEVAHLSKHYPNIDRDSVEAYVRNFITNELVFEFLEKQK